MSPVQAHQAAGKVSSDKHKITEPGILQKEIIEHASALINTAPDAGFAKPHIDALVEALAVITDISANDDLGDTLGMSLESGIALSPVQAAKCLQDLMRTHTFMHGVTRAIQDQLVTEGKVEILYAGTGPYGVLLLPVLAYLKHNRVQATLLDIQPDNIAAVTRVVECLGIEAYVRAIDLVDATKWQPQQNAKFDIILSETMNWMLKNEPQVLIFSHLQQYLRSGHSILIPQQVVLDACLYNAGQFSDYCMGQGDKPSETSLGVFARLNRETATRIAQGQSHVLDGVINLPNPLPEGQNTLKFRTEVQVYQDLWLRERQSSLCIPMCFDAPHFAPGDSIPMTYLLGPDANGQPPGFAIGFRQRTTTRIEPVSSQQVGALGIRYLKRLWHKAQLQKVGQLDPDINAKEWQADRMLMDLVGVGLGECLGFLYSEAETFDMFEQWLLESNDGGIDARRVKEINAVMDRFVRPGPITQSARSFLSVEQLAFWHEYGYLVVEGVLDKTQCQATVDLIYRFLDMYPDRPESWYQGHPALHNIMVQLFRHPILDENRRSEKARKVFVDLWQSEQLQSSIDRVGFNPPETAQYCFQGTRLHWDMDFSKPLQFSTQGLIYLTDVAHDQGAFRCVPGFHHQLQGWLDKLPSGTDPNQQDLSFLPAQTIAAPAGSLVVWHHFLPHGASPNRADLPRLVQYLNMTG
jgi:hypothetical protein